MPKSKLASAPKDWKANCLAGGTTRQLSDWGYNSGETGDDCAGTTARLRSGGVQSGKVIYKQFRQA